MIISSWNIRGLNKLVKQIEVNKFLTQNKLDILVYGSNCPVKRRTLWDSLTDMAPLVGPWVVMGDFNIVRYSHEKIGNLPAHLPDMIDFNNCLSSCGLDDIQGTGNDFTWFNKQDPSTRVYSKLDKILVNGDWLLTFTQTAAQFLSPGISDHCPALLTFPGDPAPKKQFKFLDCWIDHPDFHHQVAAAWTSRVTGNSMFRFMAKLKNTRGCLKQLHAAHFSSIGDRIEKLRTELNQCFLDLQLNPLSEDLIIKEKELSLAFWKLKDAEAKILIQRAKIHDIKLNDAGSKFFSTRIKERQQSQLIGEIQDLAGYTHQGLHEVGDAFVDYYQQLLGSSTPVQSMDLSSVTQGGCLDEYDKLLLIEPVSRGKLSLLYSPFALTKALAWMVSLLLLTFSGLDSCLNRPMSLLSHSFQKRKLSRLSKISGLSPAVLSLHENVMLTQSLVKGYQSKYLTPRCMLKVDISKAFDSIQWSFLSNMLTVLNFPGTFIKWIMGCVTGAWFTLKVNGSNYGFFKGRSGVRQGDPLSPLLFVLSMEMLSRLFRTMCTTQDVSYHPKCVKLGLTHLIFADDLMVFTRGNLPSVQKVAEILKLFASWSGLNANFEKYEAYFGGVNSVLKQHILNSIGLKEGFFPFRYFGLPIYPSRLTSTMYDPIVQKIQHLVRSCAIKFLSYVGKTEVLNSMVFGLWFEELLIKNLAIWNQANMLKWLWHFVHGSGSIWTDWIRHYFLANTSIWDLQIHEYHSESLLNVLTARDIWVTHCGSRQAAMNMLDDTYATDVSLDTCTTKGKFSIGKAYNLLKPSFPTHACYRAVQDTLLLSRHKFILMLALQRKLATADQFYKRGISIVNRLSFLLFLLGWDSNFETYSLGALSSGVTAANLKNIGGTSGSNAVLLQSHTTYGWKGIIGYSKASLIKDVKLCISVLLLHKSPTILQDELLEALNV
ncbi:uncharacterized protein LOC141600791 [Silene latifolia]|uniref:uncharacterized protein LOC141600791 n=1 Tax=Silene latifolia TaxID=37657 RepID=UPI003D77FEF2